MKLRFMMCCSYWLKRESVCGICPIPLCLNVGTSERRDHLRLACSTAHSRPHRSTRQQTAAATMTWIDAMDDWLTFVDGKSQYYLRRSSVLAHFSRGHLVMWKLLWATLLYAEFLALYGLQTGNIALPWALTGDRT